MAQSIAVKLIDSEDIIVKESEKKQLFFVGSEGEATNAVFEKAFEITNAVWPKNVFANFEIGSRMFTGQSYTVGQDLFKARGAYDLKKHPDGTVYLCMSVDYPAYDAYDKMYSCHFHRIIYRENGQVVVIQAKYGRVVPKINVYVGLSESVPYLDLLLEILDNSDAEQTTRLTMLARCVAQKYRLRHAVATQIENFVLYASLLAGGFSASYSGRKSRGKMHAYDSIKSIADYVCGACFPDWYQTPPRRRHEALGDLIDYIRGLKKDKLVPWSDEEKAFCHDIRKWIDVPVFAEVYSVSLVLLRFLSENDFTDVYSLRRVATARGVFSATIMADTIDGFHSKHLDGEAKKMFFSLSGRNRADAKMRIERALYERHAGSNVLFRNTRTLTLQSGERINEKEAKARESAAEKAVLSAGAKAALMNREELKGDANATEEFETIIRTMCESIRQLYPVCKPVAGGENAAYKKLIEIGNAFMKDEVKSMFAAKQTGYELMHELVPENSFVNVYVIGFMILRFLSSEAAQTEGFRVDNLEAAFDDQKGLQTETLKQLILEAKCIYGYYSANNILEIIAGVNTQTG